MFGSIVAALNGQLLAKLALALLLVGGGLSFRREPEGRILALYAFLGAFLAFRDLLFALLPLADLFRASDAFLFAALLELRLRPGKDRPLVWLCIGLPCAAGLVLAFGAAFGFPGDVASLALWALGLAPVAATALATGPATRLSAGGSVERLVVGRTRYILLAGSILYLAGEALLGPGSALFQSLFVLPFYGLLVYFPFSFSSLRAEARQAEAGYYKASLDAVGEIFLAADPSVKDEAAVQAALDRLLGVLIERSGASGGSLALADEFEDTISVRALAGDFPPPFKLPESLPRERERVAAFVRRSRFKVGEGLFGEAASSSEARLYRNGEGLPHNGDEEWLRSGDLITAPLVTAGRIVGVACLAAPAGAFSDEAFERCRLLSGFCAIAVSNLFAVAEASERGDIEREAAIAADVQAALLPKRFPELPGLAFGAYSSPARGVCSDYYDVVQTKADRAIVAVGDVAGKGVAASLVMVMIRTILHLITASAKDASTLLQWINRGVSGKVDLDHYATLGLVAVDASARELEYANAAHQPLILYRAEADAIETIESKGVPIGVERSTAFPSRRIALGPGDLLVMYTDGVVEAMNEQGKQFGRKNLGNAVQRLHGRGAAEVAAGIGEELEAFAGRARRHDDRTVLVMKAAGR